MIPLQILSLCLVGLGALAVVTTRDTVRLTFMTSVYGLLLVVLFLVFQAPDVALSELVVGVIAFPLILVVALSRERGE